MSKPMSYPFLAIARRYDISYASVLQVADALRDRRRRNIAPYYVSAIFAPLMAFKNGYDCLASIDRALDEFKRVQAGEFTWPDLEPVKVLRHPLTGDDVTISTRTGQIVDPVAPTMDVCPKCRGSGWEGHGMGGDTCGECGGKGMTPITPKEVASHNDDVLRYDARDDLKRHMGNASREAPQDPAKLEAFDLDAEGDSEPRCDCGHLFEICNYPVCILGTS